MRFRTRAANVPPRLATGAYILHAGWDKFHSDERRAVALHGMAVGAYPFLRRASPTIFLRALSFSEMVLGTALLLPNVSDRAAGVGLSAFAGALGVMYLRTSDLHKPGSIWPTPAGTAMSKDMWMLGIGAGLTIQSDLRAVS